MNDSEQVAALRSEVARLTSALAAAEADRDAADAALAHVKRERDAYKRAKEENDERFMCERDEARRGERIAQKIARQIEAERDAVKDSHDRMAKICDEWAAECSDMAGRIRSLTDQLATAEAEHAAFREGADTSLALVKRERDEAWKERDEWESAYTEECAAVMLATRERDALRARLDAIESGGLWARVRRVLS